MIPKKGSIVGFSDRVMKRNPKVFTPDREYVVEKVTTSLDGGIKLLLDVGTELYNFQYRIIKH